LIISSSLLISVQKYMSGLPYRWEVKIVTVQNMWQIAKFMIITFVTWILSFIPNSMTFLACVHCMSLRAISQNLIDASDLELYSYDYKRWISLNFSMRKFIVLYSSSLIVLHNVFFHINDLLLWILHLSYIFTRVGFLRPNIYRSVSIIKADTDISVIGCHEHFWN
jgi:hypothetical protein